MDWASEQKTGSGTRKAVLLALANIANHHTGQCNPSIERLAEETEFGETAVKRALKELDEMGFVIRKRNRRTDGSLSTYSYEFPKTAREDQPQSPGASSPQAGGDPQEEPGSKTLNQERDLATTPAAPVAKSRRDAC